jgi:hypothetical protein
LHGAVRWRIKLCRSKCYQNEESEDNLFHCCKFFLLCVTCY